MEKTHFWVVAAPVVLLLLALPVFSQTTAGALGKDPGASPEVAPLKPQAAEQQSETGPAGAAPAAGSASESQAKPSPLSFRIGDADFTPGGFLDFAAFFRTTNTASGVATNFGAIPYSVVDGVVNPAARLTETRSAAQGSRLSLKMTSKVSGFSVTGYVETDFAGNNATSMYTLSNSSTLRMRQFWVDVLRGKWEVLAGQGWSMMTPGRKGISSMPCDVFISLDSDLNYQVGITWVRQGQLRLVYHPNKEWAIGVSVENPDQYLTTAVALPGGSSGSYASQFDMGGNTIGNPNLMPDLIAKAAADPVLGGKHMHLELGGILRSFKDYNGSTGAKSMVMGGGVEAGANFEAIKNFYLILNGFYGAGGGRYILSLGPDVVVKPDGTLATVRSGAGVAGIEYQINKKLALFSYYGAAYFDQASYVSSYGSGGTPAYVGFGYPGSSNASNRLVEEATVGFSRTFWKNPRYGALQWINQCSYVERTPWYVAAGSSSNAHMSMVHATLCYVLP